MAAIDEIARDVYRISIHVPQFDLQFNHFLVKDEQPLLFHTGMRTMFPEMWEAVSRLIDPASLRWISWSHFEVDECGALNEWLARAPQAQAACGQVGRWSTSRTSPLVRLSRWLQAMSSRRGVIDSSGSPRLTCRTGGMQACSSKSRTACCSALISFTNSGPERLLLATRAST